MSLRPELTSLSSGHHIKTQNADGHAFILGCKRWPLLPGSPPGCVRTFAAQSADLHQAMQEKKALSWRGRGCLRGFLELRRPWGFSPEARRGSQGASRAAPGRPRRPGSLNGVISVNFRAELLGIKIDPDLGKLLNL